jgi:N-methylhydantoinase B
VLRRAIAEIPDGDYAGEVQSDGFSEPVTLRCVVRVRGDGLTVDFAGSSPQVPWGINVPLCYTASYTTYALKCALAPEVPNNEGSFRPVHVSAPERCILHALPPAPVGARHIIGHFLPGAIFGALAQALPDRVLAEGAANIWATQLTGRNDDESFWTYVWFSTGGTGARPTKDGISTVAFPSGISGVPTEMIESLSPVVIERREYRQDSGGPGRYRGGLGQTLTIGVRSAKPYTFSPIFDRTKFAAQGYQGGQPGALASITASNGVVFDTKGVREFPPGTTLELKLPGGGGFYDPFTRDPEAVRQDVIDELVSLAAARENYGVVIDSTTLEVDPKGTAELRANDSR